MEIPLTSRNSESSLTTTSGFDYSWITEEDVGWTGPNIVDLITWYQDDTSDLISLNSVHIIGESIPSLSMMEHYAKALVDVDKYNAVKAAGISINEIHEKMKELSEEEMEAFLNEKYGEIDQPKDSGDTGNIIRFNPKGTMH